MANNPQNPGSQETIDVPNVINQETSSDWQEYTASDGRRYFYNKRRKVSSWDKPLELMTPLEKVDSSTVWKVYTTAEGKKYYYNKETKQCTWNIPDDLKLAREQAEKEASRRSQSGMVPNTHTPTTVTPSTLEPSLASSPVATIAHKARGRNHREQPTVPPVDLPPNAWLRFPNTINPSYLNDLNNKLKKYMRRDIEVAHSLDWDLADQTGLSAAMEDLLVQKYRSKDDEVLFTCHAWRNLFQTRECIYRELVLEFHSTVWFNQISTDYNDRRVFTFRLGGKSRQCSLRELSWRLGLYTYEETKSIHFLPFLEDAVTAVRETEFQVGEFWAAIANGEYDSRIAVEGRLRSPIHRLLHRLIATSLNHRRGSGMVSTFDLFYLWCLLTPDVHLNIPFTVALYLVQRAIETTPKTSPICGGHFVTRLALSYGILTRENMDQLVRYEPRTIDLSFLEDMRVLRMEHDGIARIVGTDAVEQHEGSMEDESTQLTQPTKRRRLMDLQFLSGRVDGLGRAVRELRHTVAGLGLYQDDVRQYQFGLQDQIQWIGTAMSSLLTQQGLAVPSPFPAPPPQYPSWGRRFPTHTPPRDNRAGLSNTNHESNDE